MYEIGNWQKYKYAVAAIIAIMVFCAFMLSYIAVTLPAAASATNALNNISITNYTIQPLNSTPPPLLSFSLGSSRINLGQGNLYVTNEGDQNLTLTLTMSAIVTSYNTLNNTHTNYNLGSIIVPNVIINAHSHEIIPATLNDITPIASSTGWNQKPSGYWSYSCSVQASISEKYLFWYPAVGYRTFEFNGSATIL